MIVAPLRNKQVPVQVSFRTVIGEPKASLCRMVFADENAGFPASGICQ